MFGRRQAGLATKATEEPSPVAQPAPLVEPQSTTEPQEGPVDDAQSSIEMVIEELMVRLRDETDLSQALRISRGNLARKIAHGVEIYCRERSCHARAWCNNAPPSRRIPAGLVPDPVSPRAWP